MELIRYNSSFLAAYQRQGNDKNGNPIYIINIFQEYGNGNFHNCNSMSNNKLDKYDNIRITSYNIDDTISSIIKRIQK
jgi:hypothetical protein